MSISISLPVDSQYLRNIIIQRFVNLQLISGIHDIHNPHMNVKPSTTGIITNTSSIRLKTSLEVITSLLCSLDVRTQRHSHTLQLEHWLNPGTLRAFTLSCHTYTAVRIYRWMIPTPQTATINQSRIRANTYVLNLTHDRHSF